MSALAAGSISRISIRDLLGGTGRSRSRGAASVYGRRRQVSSKARCGVVPMAIDGAPRRRSGDRRLLDEDLTAVQSTIPDKSDQVSAHAHHVKLPLTQPRCQGILDTWTKHKLN